MEYYLFFEDENGNLHQVGYVNGAGLESKEIMDSLWVQMEKYIHLQKEQELLMKMEQ